MGGSSASRNQSSLLEDTHTSRSLISRLFSRSKTRHITDFHIRPVDPHRKYAKGDHVTGAVVLTVLRPIRITHLTVALHGFVKVFKSPNAAHEATINTAQIASGVTNRTRYLGNGLASLFQDEQVLSADGKLEAGRYEFNFDLVFPSKVNLPTSIDVCFPTMPVCDIFARHGPELPDRSFLLTLRSHFSLSEEPYHT